MSFSWHTDWFLTGFQLQNATLQKVNTVWDRRFGKRKRKQTWRTPRNWSDCYQKIAGAPLYIFKFSSMCFCSHCPQSTRGFKFRQHYIVFRVKLVYKNIFLTFCSPFFVVGLLFPWGSACLSTLLYRSQLFPLWWVFELLLWWILVLGSHLHLGIWCVAFSVLLGTPPPQL